MENLIAKLGIIGFIPACLALVVFAPKANALTLESQTFTIAQDKEDFDNASEVLGFDFRSSDFDPLGLVDEYGADALDLAEIGTYKLTELEIIRSFAELDLEYYKNLRENDLDTYNALDIQLSLDVFKQGGLRDTNDFGFSGVVELLAYRGDGEEELTDFYTNLFDTGSIPPEFFDFPPPLIGTILLDGTETKGTTYSFNIKNYVTLSLLTNTSDLGILLKMTDSAEANATCDNDQCNTAVTFYNFRTRAVPTPAAVLPSLLGLVSMATRKKKMNCQEEV